MFRVRTRGKLHRLIFVYPSCLGGFSGSNLLSPKRHLVRFGHRPEADLTRLGTVTERGITSSLIRENCLCTWASRPRLPVRPLHPPSFAQLHRHSRVAGGSDADAHVTEPTLGASPDAARNCLAQTICSVKERIRWQTPAWTPSQCRKIADAVSTSAKRHDLSPSLLLAIMVNESDMNEKSARAYERDGRIYAKDGGLMAIRCLLGDHDRCTNGNVRGVPFKELMDPVNNIEAGARELALWRDGGGVARTTIVKRDAEGHLHRVTKDVPCQHKTHAWWAHYNHGPRYIDKGYPRHYPHRIAVLDHAFATVMNAPAPELTAGRDHDSRPGQARANPQSAARTPLPEALLADPFGGTCSALALN